MLARPIHSSHGVGVGSVSAVWLQAGSYSRRRLSEIIVVVVVVVVGVVDAVAVIVVDADDDH